jgi:protein-S-isoprenylcysteine O-methyltransferase Ste14
MNYVKLLVLSALTHLQLLVRCVQVYESFLIFYKVFPALRRLPLPSWARPSPATLAQVLKLRVTPSFFIGTAIVCVGAYLRSVCFHYLGRQFTFQLSIREDHRLITHGPYAIVRHPAYASAIIQLCGLLMCLNGPGAWFKEIGIQSTTGKIVAAIVGVQLTLCTFAGIDRTFKEDALLRQIFKGQWEEWAKKTPYKLFPFLF